MRSAVIDLAAQPIRNYARMASFAGIVPGQVNSHIGNMGASPAPLSITIDSVDVPAPFTSVAVFTANGTGQWSRKFLMDNPPLRTGMVMRWRVLVKSSIAYSGVGFAEGFFPDGSTYSGSGSVGAFTLTPNVWTWLEFSYTVPSNKDGHTYNGVGILMSGTLVVAGDVFKLAAAMVTFDQPLPDLHCDGDTPGWRWTGTPHASASVGYPYTLESIAGQPWLSVAGTGTASGTHDDPYQGRTAYLVTDISGVIADNARMLYLGNNLGLASNRGSMTIDAGTGSTLNINSRIDLPNGSTNTAARLGGVATIGRHVACTQLVSGLTSGALIVDQSAEVFTPALSPGDGWVNSQLVISAPTFSSPVIAIAYKDAHSLQTRRQIMAWLARRYGAPIPTGY